jgi:hypothetical protein
MAAEAEHDCPHCPPTEQRELPPCDEIFVQDCAIDDQLSAESRSLQIKAKDSPNDSPIAIAPSYCAVETPAVPTQAVPHIMAFLNPSGPPRNVLFCVYLK